MHIRFRTLLLTKYFIPCLVSSLPFLPAMAMDNSAYLLNKDAKSAFRIDGDE